MNKILVPKTKHALIKFIRIVLSLKTTSKIYYTDVEVVKNKMINHLYKENLSPREIKELYNFQYTDFGMFLKKCLKIELKSVKDSVNNYFIKSGKNLTNKKQIYQNDCQFQFDPYSYKEIPGYDLLLERGIYHPTENPNGMCRDHIISIEFGYRNNIDPTILSHKANCQFISNIKNVSKGSGSSLSLDQLKQRIDEWNNGNISPISDGHKQLPKTKEHRENLRKANLGLMNFTNGKENIRISKIDPIPNGFWRGMTRGLNK